MQEKLGRKRSALEPQDFVIVNSTARFWGFVFLIDRGYADEGRITRIGGQMELLYSDQTREIIGALYKVYNQLGYGYREKEYQRAFASELERLGIKFKRELYCHLKFNGEIISKFYIDFLVEYLDKDIKIVVELKVVEDFHKKFFDQTMTYLTTNKLQLGLLAIFTRKNVLIKRIINQKG
jgi:GxxExxY protein